MNLQNLRVFLKVADLEHVTHAAEELNLSQPAVTKIIQSLEHEINLELVERQGRRIVLTHAGRVIQQYARQLFALEHEMEDALAALRDVDGGEVTLAVNTTAWVYLLPPIVARFRQEYPRVQLHITVLNSREIIDGTQEWALDFGLIEGSVSTLPPLLNARVVTHDKLILIAAPGHPLSALERVTPEALIDHELLLREQGSGIREFIEQEFSVRHLQIQPLLTLTDNEAIKQMVLNGVGAALVSELTVQQEWASRKLIVVPIAGLQLRPQLIFIQREDKQLSRAAQAFCAFLFSYHDIHNFPMN